MQFLSFAGSVETDECRGVCEAHEAQMVGSQSVSIHPFFFCLPPDWVDRWTFGT